MSMFDKLRSLRHTAENAASLWRRVGGRAERDIVRMDRVDVFVQQTVAELKNIGVPEKEVGRHEAEILDATRRARHHYDAIIIASSGLDAAMQDIAYHAQSISHSADHRAWGRV